MQAVFNIILVTLTSQQWSKDCHRAGKQQIKECKYFYCLRTTQVSKESLITEVFFPSPETKINQKSLECKIESWIRLNFRRYSAPSSKHKDFPLNIKVTLFFMSNFFFFFFFDVPEYKRVRKKHFSNAINVGWPSLPMYIQ